MHSVTVRKAMGKATAEKAAITRQKIIDIAFEITMKEGFEKATFVHIARSAGISSSGINAHFARKSDIAEELVPIYSKIIKRPLRFDSPESFYQSWVIAFNTDKVFRSAIQTAGPIIPKLHGVKGLFDSISGKKDEVERCIYMCVGYAVVNG